jgi:hypothetical protein
MNSSSSKSGLAKVLLAVGGLLILGCSGVAKDAFNQGLNESAKKEGEKAKTMLAKAAASPAKTEIEKVLKATDTALANGKMEGIGASMVYGGISGAAEDGKIEDGEVAAAKALYDASIKK